MVATVFWEVLGALRSLVSVYVRAQMAFVHALLLDCVCSPPFSRLAVSTCALSDGLVVALAVAWPMLQICFPALRCTFSFAWLVIGLQSFMCTMAEASLRQHAESKHPKSTFELCFPTYAKA